MIKITDTLESFLNARNNQINSNENSFKILQTLSVYNEFTYKTDRVFSPAIQGSFQEKPQMEKMPIMQATQKKEEKRKEEKTKAVAINISKRNRKLTSHKGIVK